MSGGDKLVIIEIGVVVIVLFFVNIGDFIIVNTEDGTYKSRV